MKGSAIEDVVTEFAIQLFGSFSALSHGAPLPRMRSRKEQWLLALLALRARESPVDRLWLAGTLWPESDESNALFYLRRSLSLLRDAMGPEGHRISSPTPRTLSLDLSLAACDVADFDNALRRGDDSSLVLAVDLYRGPLLAECTEDWVFPEREKREHGVLLALDKLALRTVAAGDSLASISYLRRILELDPLRESTLRDLMEALAAQGSAASAGETYRIYRARLRRDHDSEPDAATVYLDQRIRAEARACSEESGLSTTVANLSGTRTALTSRGMAIPTALSPLIGRQAERDSVVSQIGASRLVTLTGTGGVGKTRLGLAVAESVAANFVDGVWFVDLTLINNARLLARSILDALDSGEIAGDSDLLALAAFIHSRSLLIVLDNCEQVLEGAARLVYSLLKNCPNLRVLATSREPLHIAEEIVWPVPSLALEEAALLFTTRASQASPAFQASPGNRDSVNRICDRLDGVPLAIEMAAARTRGISAQQIATHLEGVFRLLNLSGRIGEPRHQTLRATMRWSYDLLTNDEQVLLARLSIFSGGWTLEAAEAVCAGDSIASDAVLETLLALVDKSLVIYAQSERDVGRYSFLEMTRQYAAELLGSQEHGALSDRHADYFAKRAIEMRFLQGQPAEHEAVNRFEAELPNVRTALQWCRTAGRVQCGLRLAGCLGKFWLSRGHVSEGRQLVTAALDAVPDADSFLEERLIALMCLGILAQSRHDIDEACRRFLEALPLAEALDSGDRCDRMFADPILAASVLFNLGVAFQAKQNRLAARQSLKAALALWSDASAEQGIAKCRHSLGQLALAEDDFDEAESQFEQALASFEASGNLYFVAQTCLDIAAVLRRRVRHLPAADMPLPDRERAFLRRAVAIGQTIDAKLEMAWAVEALAHRALLQSRFQDAARLRGVSASLREAITDIALTTEEIEQLRSDIACCRNALGEAGFDAAVEAGRAMNATEAVAFALQV